MPLISVIIPVFNCEAYLRSCLESVLSQTLDDFETIVIDDGSTDGSPATCDEYAFRDSRIRVVHQDNRGVSEARNTGLKLAIGEYIFFMDGDDMIMPETLECLFSAAASGNYDIAASGYYRVRGKEVTEFHLIESGHSSVFTGEEVIDWMLSYGDLACLLV